MRLMRSLPRAAALLFLVVAAHPAQASDPDPLPPLVQVLSEAEDYKARLTAVLGLARLKDARAVQPLIKALADSHHMVRGAAARALGAVEAREARTRLEALVQSDPDDYVRAQAQGALATLMKAEEAASADKPGGMELLGSLGTLSQHAIRRGLTRPTQKASACLGKALATAPFLGGQIALKFRVKTDGAVRWVRIQDSDLGSLQAERCMRDEMALARFDRPDGGEAEFSVPLAFGGGDAVELLSPETSAAAADLREQCGAALVPAPIDEPDAPPLLTPPGGLVLTLYIDQKGSVLSVGMSAGGAELPDALADRLAHNLGTLALKDPKLKGARGKLVLPFACTEEQRQRWLKRRKKKKRGSKRRGKRRRKKK